MKKLVPFMAFSFLIFLHLNILAQVSAKVTGAFEGSSEGDVVLLESSNFPASNFSTIIQKGRFSFDIKVDDEWKIYFISCPEVSESYKFPLMLKRGSVLDFSVDNSFQKPVISGDWIRADALNFRTHHDIS